MDTSLEPNQTTVAAPDPGKGLGIAGFITSFFVSIVGLILSSIALSKSKKAGHSNGLAIAGIVIGALGTLFWTTIFIFATILATSVTTQVLEKCSEASSTQSRVYVDGKQYDCPVTSSSHHETSKHDSMDTIDIADTKVTLAGSKVDSDCFSFTLPEGYMISPASKACQTELRLDNGSETGVSLTSISVKYQTGGDDVDSFFKKYKAAGGDKISDAKELTIDGQPAGSLTLVDTFGIKQTVYFITAHPGMLEINGTPVTSFHISGPTNLTKELATITESFTLK